MRVILDPGQISLASWRAIYHGGAAVLAPARYAAIARCAVAVEAIVARGDPVYGINTGFGRLANIRIDAGDLSRLQCNLVLSHAAGVGEATPVPVVRLMMALKIASLSQGASGVRAETVRLLEAMLARDVIPCVPCQGSVGASGDLAPLAHMASAMLGVGEVSLDGSVLPAAVALERAGLAPLALGPKEGLALLNGTQFSTAYALAGLFEAETTVAGGIGHRCAVHRRRARVRYAVRSAHSCAAPAPGADRCGAGAACAAWRQRDPGVSPEERRPCAGPVLPTLPASGDGGRADGVAPGRRPRWTTKPTACRTIRWCFPIRRRCCQAAISTASLWPSRRT